LRRIGFFIVDSNVPTSVKEGRTAHSRQDNARNTTTTSNCAGLEGGGLILLPEHRYRHQSLSDAIAQELPAETSRLTLRHGLRYWPAQNLPSANGWVDGREMIVHT